MAPQTPEHIVRRATAAFNAGRSDEARKLCEEGLKDFQDEPMLNHLLAAVLLASGEPEAARAYVEASLVRRPDNAAALLLAARLARTTREFDRALSHLDRAIAIAPRREAIV
jgi:tetratricopeptide (TPR) repeat protein